MLTDGLLDIFCTLKALKEIMMTLIEGSRSESKQIGTEKRDTKDVDRNLRFERVMGTVRSAIQSRFTSPDISDDDLIS